MCHTWLVPFKVYIIVAPLHLKVSNFLGSPFLLLFTIGFSWGPNWWRKIVNTKSKLKIVFKVVAHFSIQSQVWQADRCPTHDTSGCKCINRCKEPELKWILLMFQDVFVTDNPIYIKVIPLRPLKTFVLLNDSFEEVPFVEISLDEFHDVFTYIRLIGSIPLVCDTEPDAISQHFETIRKKVCYSLFCKIYKNYGIKRDSQLQQQFFWSNN